jgi:proline racemase
MKGVKGIIQAVDYHTGGQPVRVLTGGLPPIHGRTMREKADYVKRHLDWIRTAVCFEPRGHKDMFAVILTEPCDPRADFGVIWVDNPGVYIGMCGHGTFGVSAMLADLGYARGDDPLALALDTPGGLVHVTVRRQPGPTTTTLENVPAFHLASAVVDVDGLGQLPVDVSYGGLFFVQVDVDALPAQLDLEKIYTFVELWPKLRVAVQRAVPLWHPQPHVQLEYTNSFFYQRRDGGRAVKNVMVYGDGGKIDRSPCGTGTCAYMALVVARGELAVGEQITMYGSLGSHFLGRALAEVPIGPDRVGIRPEITSPAFLSGTHQLMLNEEDPLTLGFELPTDSGFRLPALSPSPPATTPS